MIPLKCQYKGFTTQESNNVDRIVDYLGMSLFEVKNNKLIFEKA